jgi:hypothetical protein
VRYQDLQEAELHHQPLAVEERKQCEVDEQRVELAPQKGESGGENPGRSKSYSEKKVRLIAMKYAKDFTGRELRIDRRQKRVHG